jgi:hypothetical protein
MKGSARFAKSSRLHYPLFAFFVLLLLPIFLVTTLLLFLIGLVYRPLSKTVPLLIVGTGLWMLHFAKYISVLLVQKSYKLLDVSWRELEVWHLRRGANRRRIGQPLP